MPTKHKVGVIGVGDMGGPMAQHLIDSPHPTYLWARRPPSLEQYEDGSFHRCATVAEMGSECDVVGLCVFNDDDVDQIVTGEGGLLSTMKTGSIILVHATITVETAQEIAGVAKAKGIDVIDAPVSGARARSVEGALTIMCGGDREAFVRAMPVMQCYGKSIKYLGPSGSGQKVKVLNNVLGFANLLTAYIAIETGKKMGLEPDAMMEVLRTSSGGSFNLNILIDRLLPDPSFARHALSMTEKDTQIFQEVCADAGIARSILDDAAEGASRMLGNLGKG